VKNTLKNLLAAEDIKQTQNDSILPICIMYMSLLTTRLLRQYWK